MVYSYSLDLLLGSLSLFFKRMYVFLLDDGSFCGQFQFYTFYYHSFVGIRYLIVVIEIIVSQLGSEAKKSRNALDDGNQHHSASQSAVLQSL